jgi:serine/threonine protein kinase
MGQPAIETSGLGTSFSFQLVKGDKKIQFCTNEKEDYMAWMSCISCYGVGTNIHTYFQLEDLLGQGSFGIVYLARPTEESLKTLGNLDQHSKVAIKQINKQKMRASG